MGFTGADGVWDRFRTAPYAWPNTPGALLTVGTRLWKVDLRG